MSKNKIVRTPTRAEGGITPEEKEAMKRHSDLWIARALRTDPIDPEKIIPAIKGLYRVSGLAEPRVVIVPSPLVMALAGGFAAGIWYLRNQSTTRISGTITQSTRSATGAATYDALDAATRAATEDATDAATEDATRFATYAATSAATEDATSDATGAATAAATAAATLAATHATPDDATSCATGAATDVATRYAIRQAIRGAIDAVTDVAATSATAYATASATAAATLAATRFATAAAIDAPTDAATYAATDDATGDATSDATRSAASDATRSAAARATYAATDAATHIATEDATFAATATRDATSDATYVATRYATSYATSYATGDATRFLLDCARKWANMYQGGNMWAPWDCYLTAARDILGLQLPSHAAYKYWEDAAINGGFRIMHPEFCMVSDFPEFLKMDDQHRPHCDTGPSHRWRDGWSIYHLNGVRVPAWLVNTPAADMDPRKLVEIDNAEVRREFVRKIGAQRIVSALSDGAIDARSYRTQDGREHPYELHRLKITDDEQWTYLRMVNPSIGLVHFEGVPNECDTVQSALNFRAGLTSKQISDDGAEWIQQGDVCLFPEGATKFRPFPAQLT